MVWQFFQKENKNLKRIMLFAGTTEGRKLMSFFEEKEVVLSVCVATEYGKEVIESSRNITIIQGRLSAEQMKSNMEAAAIEIVIDATHPFAKEASKNIKQAAKEANSEYFRLLRKPELLPEHAVEVENLQEAVLYLQQTMGNIFIATGSKDLEIYRKIKAWEKRCYVRVIPAQESINKCMELGVKGEHLIAMQGPFSKEMNTATLKHINAKYFVTKEAGKEGGFLQKAEAAKEAGAVLLVIKRPKETGYLFEELCQVLQEEIKC